MALHRLAPIPPRDKQVRVLDKPGETEEWLSSELQEYVAQVGVEEAQNQIRLDNPPNQMRIDRARPVDLKPVDVRDIRSTDPKDVKVVGLKSRLTFTFADLTAMYKAVEFAYQFIENNIRKDSGTGFESMYFWLSDPDGTSKRAESLAEVKTFLENAQSPSTSVHLLGPTVPYRRQLIYNPKTKPKFKYIPYERVGDRYKFAKTDFRARIRRNRTTVQVLTAIQELAMRRIRTRFKGVNVWYGFTRSREKLSVGRHIPVLYFNIQRRR